MCLMGGEQPGCRRRPPPPGRCAQRAKALTQVSVALELHGAGAEEEKEVLRLPCSSW